MRRGLIAAVSMLLLAGGGTVLQPTPGLPAGQGERPADPAARAPEQAHPGLDERLPRPGRGTSRIQTEQLTGTILSDPKHQDPKKLNQYEYKVSSQNGEDGIIAEIFRRIGTKNRYFVEFGAASGRRTTRPCSSGRDGAACGWTPTPSP